MQISQDGLVFVKIGVKKTWYINVASIVRIFDHDKETCDILEMQFPSIGLDIIGREDHVNIGGVDAKGFKKKIDKAVKEHYDRIINSELLGE